MALNDSYAPSSGVWGAIKGALGLFADINKAQGVSENQNPQPIDPYESKLSEMEIVMLVDQWKRRYTTYYSDVEPTQRVAFEYWLGKQRSEEAETIQGNSPLVDNKIFESIETFIPIATRANPDPLVQADPGDLGDTLSHSIKQALVFEADRLKLRKILKRDLRDWIIKRLGVIKMGYDLVLDQITIEVINPQRMIFDPDGHWDEAGFFTGEWLGEKKKMSADKLIELFPRKAQYIKMKAKNKLGTKLEYMEWWYRRRDFFFTMDDEVLGKFKNPHWNWDVPAGEDPQTQPGQAGINHFSEPHDPYIGLSIFSTGLQPHDETSLILQNIGIQDMINRRWRQIDKNVESMNNGLIVSSVFTDAQASQAASALRRGTAIRVPTQVNGSVANHVQRFAAEGIPSDVFNSMQDARSELKNIFGTSGSTPEGIESQQTVRGQILTTQLDASRIGGGVTEYLEQVADTAYNYMVQLMFVHYTDVHYFQDAGSTGGAQLIGIKNTDLALLKTLDITVKEGSLIPKDPLTQRNEAMDLWSANAIDPVTFYKRLDFSDPTEAAQQLLMWQLVQKGAMPPQMYLPNFPQPGQPGAPVGAIPGQQPGTGGPAVNPVGPNTPPPAPAPATSGAVQSQEHQLISSVPIPR